MPIPEADKMMRQFQQPTAFKLQFPTYLASTAKLAQRLLSPESSGQTFFFNTLSAVTVEIFKQAAS
jgi:hypothetical protein